MSEEEVLQMMEHTTWLTADQALERGLIDAIMFQEAEPAPLVAGPLFALPTKEQMEKVSRALKGAAVESGDSAAALVQFNLLKMRGEVL